MIRNKSSFKGLYQVSIKIIYLKRTGMYLMLCTYEYKYDIVGGCALSAPQRYQIRFLVCGFVLLVARDEA